jgi:hypothetical protein
LCSQLLFLDLLIHQVTIMTFHIFTLFLLYILLALTFDFFQIRSSVLLSFEEKKTQNCCRNIC